MLIYISRNSSATPSPSHMTFTWICGKDADWLVRCSVKNLDKIWYQDVQNLKCQMKFCLSSSAEIALED